MKKMEQAGFEPRPFSQTSASLGHPIVVSVTVDMSGPLTFNNTHSVVTVLSRLG